MSGFAKLETFVPEAYAGRVLAALREAGAGRVGSSPPDRCAATSQVTGHWRPLEGAEPFSGTVGEVASEPEVKIEVTVAIDKLDDAVAAVREAHPYEEPVIYAIPLLIP